MLFLISTVAPAGKTALLSRNAALGVPETTEIAVAKQATLSHTNDSLLGAQSAKFWEVRAGKVVCGGLPTN